MCEFSRDEWEADNALNNYDWSVPDDVDIMEICDGDCTDCWYDCFPDFEVWQEEGYLFYKNEKLP